MFYYNFDYMFFMLPALIIVMLAQANISSTFNKYQRVRASRGYTGADVARMILDRNGLNHIRIEQVAGNLTDHYDPRTGVVRLSTSTYGSQSVAALGVAAHEVGHALQHAQGYAPLKIRNTIIPVTNIGSRLAIPLILFGFLLTWPELVTFGILAFSLVVVFQLVTLPVEFNASRRALDTMQNMDILYGDELTGARKVLTAAALTYVAALLQAITQLLYYISRFGGRRRN